MFYGAPTMDLSKKKPLEFASRKRSETVEKQAFSCNGADFKKKPPRQILRLSINMQKPLGKFMFSKGWPATIQERPKRTWTPEVDAHEGHSGKPLEFLEFRVGAG